MQYSFFRLPDPNSENKIDFDFTYNDTTCAICLSHHLPGNTVRVLPCKHIYHKRCIDPWFFQHQTCPICKDDILKAVGLPYNFRISQPVQNRQPDETQLQPLYFNSENNDNQNSENISMITAPRLNEISSMNISNVNYLEGSDRLTLASREDFKSIATKSINQSIIESECSKTAEEVPLNQSFSSG